MSNWIDRHDGYAWTEPLARDLHRRLVTTFYEPQQLCNLVRRANAPDWTKINWSNSPNGMWIDVLSLAALEGSLRELLQFIIDEERVAKPLTAFIEDILADRRPPADPAPGGGPGGPDFASGITKDEALLFGEDLSESVGEVPALLASVALVLSFRTAVCRLLVTAHDGSRWNGTGTLLTDQRVLTNHHVLFPRQQKCTDVRIEFNYEQDARGQKTASTVVVGDVASIRSDAADDWAVVSVVPPPGITPVDLGATIAAPVAAERAFILQHPDGDPKRLAFVRNRIATVATRRVYYLTDTRGGSSGAPVFDARGCLIALHRAGGEPQLIPGADPLKKNEGVRLDAIVAAIESH